MSEKDQVEKRTDYIFRAISWLFQRFNYFLIGTAFLVTALAAIASSQYFALNDGNGYLAWLARVVCAAGYSLCVFFVFVNHHESIGIRSLFKTLNDNLNKYYFY